MNRLRFLLLACFLFVIGTLHAPAGAQTTGDWRFGVVEAYTAPNSARELGTAWTRVRFQWADTQADGPDSWTPPISDELVEQELAAGRLVVGLLIGIPEWARDEDGLPQGLWLPHDDPGNSWGTFVRQMVERYAGRIDHWVIWNEPDIEATAVAHTWDGSVEDFAQLQRVAYLAAKDANPDATLHLSAFTYWADVAAGREQYMARLLDEILSDPQAAQNAYYFDVATAHLYFQPDQIYDLLILFQEIMQERGVVKPIWLVETNAPPHDDPAWPVPEQTLSVMQDEQAAFMPQALASALAAGAERIAVYKMQDTRGDREANPEPFGLLRQDGSRRPAYRALKVAMQYMGGSSEVRRERWDEVGQFHFEQQDRTTTVLFARLADPQQVMIEAVADTALLVDLRGTKEQIEAEDGRYVIDLPPALCIQSIGDYCMIGGSTFYLIQAKNGGDAPEGPPPVLPQPAITSTSVPTATSTATATATPSPVPTLTNTVVPPSLASTALPTLTAVAPPSPTAVATQLSQVVEVRADSGSVDTAETEEGRAGDITLFAVGVVVVGVGALVGWWISGKRKA
jgi:hypothetical protein